MTNADLAQRLAALDWSGTTLQHQLAVGAAIETLKEIPQTAVDALAAYKLAKNSAYGHFGNLDAIIAEAPSIAPDCGVAINAVYQSSRNVVALPVRRMTRWTTLFQLDGREWASSTHFAGPGDAWGWVQETVAREHGVSEDQVSSIEGDEAQFDGDDLVTVDGVAVYRLRHVAKPSAT